MEVFLICFLLYFLCLFYLCRFYSSSTFLLFVPLPCLRVWESGGADMWSRGEYFEQKNRRIVQQITEEGSYNPFKLL